MEDVFARLVHCDRNAIRSNENGVVMNGVGAGKAFYGNGNEGMKIGELLEPVYLFDPDALVCDIKKMFEPGEPLKAAVVATGRKPVGLVMNIHLDRTLSQRFGFALHYNKPIKRVMDVAPLIVDIDTPLEMVAKMAMKREKSKIFDHIIITEKAEIAGIVSIRDILNTMANNQKKNAHELNRINLQLHQEIEERSKAESSLIHLNQVLEQRVMQRTAEIARSNQNLKKAVEVAEAANRAKSDFLANMSHELRTPLNHIIGFTELVLEQHFGPLNETQGEYLSDVLSSSNHLLSLINDILDLSKVEAGKLELHKSDIDLRRLLENSIVMIKEKAQKHNIRLSTDFCEAPEIIEGDTRKLKQILYNLLSNAVKFTPAGGRIRLSAYLRDAASLSGRNKGPLDVNSHTGDYVEISIRDTGIGLKAEDKERIFNPFEQADSARNRNYQGTGLGLSLTRKLVELHQGCIWAESQGEGRGSDFHVIIPSRQTYPSFGNKSCLCAENEFAG